MKSCEGQAVVAAGFAFADSTPAMISLVTPVRTRMVESSLGSYPIGANSVGDVAPNKRFCYNYAS